MWVPGRRALVESFYSSPAAEGISVMFDRDAMIEARVRQLPGYFELVSRPRPPTSHSMAISMQDLTGALNYKACHLGLLDP